MFDVLQKRLSSALQKVRGKTRITEVEVDAVLSEIRTGLLEADVHFRVARDFLARVKERCLREEVIKSLSPEQQILRVLSDELTTIFGGQSRDLQLNAKAPVVILLCGLQGSGKTTSCSKLALLLKGQSKRVGAVSVDVYRPAAIAQLKSLGEKYGFGTFEYPEGTSPLKRAESALKAASDQNLDILLVDTAGRLQLDEALMNELKELHSVLKPSETLLVIDAMMGQQAVEVAEGFDRAVNISGAILSKLDGDSKGGAALSLVSVTGKPIKFIGTGERATDFEAFHPERVTSRLLDMGDVMSLLEKAQQVISEEEAMEAATKFSNPSDFSLEDFRNQLKMLSRMGPVSGLLKMLPGFGAMKEQIEKVDTEKEMSRVNAILNSMTPQERKNPDVLNGSRKIRIAKGSGVDVSEVNSLIKRFLDARKMMKQFGKMAGKMGMGSGGANPMGGGGRSGPSGRGFGRKF